MIGVGDEGGVASLLYKGEHRLDLWRHAPGAKVTGCQIAGEFAGGNMGQVLLVRRVEMDSYIFNARGDQKEIDIQLLRQQTTGPIFVHHSIDPFDLAQLSFGILHYRNATTTGGDHHMISIQQCCDDRRFQNRQRLG